MKRQQRGQGGDSEKGGGEDFEELVGLVVSVQWALVHSVAGHSTPFRIPLVFSS